MKFILLLALLISCNSKTEPEKDVDYFIQVFGKSYICESYFYVDSGYGLVDCENVIDANDKLAAIRGATNFIAVGDLK